MTDDLAEQLEAARTAFAQDGHDARLPPSVQQKCYQMPSQFLIQVHAERCTAEKANTFARARKTVIAAGTKHHSASAVSLLDVVSLEQCKFGINNNQGAARARGKALLLRRCKETGSYRTTGLHILAEDSQGWMVPVLILNASSQYEVLLQPDTVFLIKEPWIKASRDGYIVRVETPTDICEWPSCIPCPEAFKSKQAADHYKRVGSSHFVKGRFGQALDAYRAGIYHQNNSSEDLELALLRLNASAAALKVDLPGLALKELDALDSQHLTEVQRRKATHRGALALYQFEEYAQAIAILDGQQTEESRDLSHRAQRRRREQTSGAFDWPETYRLTQAGNLTQDIADYVGAITVKLAEDRGKGLFATETIEPGQLLLVSKPLASAKPDHSKLDVVLGLNLSSNSLDTYTQVSVPGLLAYKCLHDPAVLHKVGELYPGVQFSDMAGESSPEPETHCSLDIGRIEGICTYNSFRPVSITEMYDEDPKSLSAGQSESSNHLHSASALYHLPSFMNHACIGNACYSFFGDTFLLRALKRIEAGEEVLDSYCNAMDPLPRRTEHLGRYGFTCGCTLCYEDQADGKASIARRQSILYQLQAQRKKQSSTDIEGLITEIRKTYRSSRSGPRPDLYACYRSLAQALSDPDVILEAELLALEALGAVFTRSRPAKVSGQQSIHVLVSPALGLQDAINSYLKLSNDSLRAAFLDGARFWLDEAKRLHAIVYGPELFGMHMEPLIQTQGWSALMEL